MRTLKEIRDLRYNDIPTNLISRRCKTKLKALLASPDGNKVSDEYNHTDVRKKLRKYHGLKCVYCESSPIATSTFRVDHFRPKKYIKELPKTKHRGYYWLAYEWSNLLQSCELCNKSKSNSFPLHDEATRVCDATLNALEEDRRKPTAEPLCNESRLLLHPELDEVESHFFFRPDGSIASNTNQGQSSIRCYGLDRGDLNLSRKKIRDEEFEKIEKLVLYYNEDQSQDSRTARALLKRGLVDLFRDWLSRFKGGRQYSLYYFCMFDQFENFFLDPIFSSSDGETIREIYLEYREGGIG